MWPCKGGEHGRIAAELNDKFIENTIKMEALRSMLIWSARSECLRLALAIRR